MVNLVVQRKDHGHHAISIVNIVIFNFRLLDIIHFSEPDALPKYIRVKFLTIEPKSVSESSIF